MFSLGVHFYALMIPNYAISRYCEPRNKVANAYDYWKINIPVILDFKKLDGARPFRIASVSRISGQTITGHQMRLSV